MFCKNCGNKLNGDVQFCTNCGRAVSNEKIDNNQNVKNIKKDSNVGKVVLCIICGCIVFIGIIIFSIIVTTAGLLTKTQLDYEISNKIVEDEAFIGNWIVYDKNSDSLLEGNYFTFNSDNTFSWGASKSGMYTGTYSYKDGAKTSGDGRKYFDVESENKYRFYTITMTPTKFVKLDNSVVTDGLRSSTYAIGISYDRKTMIAMNLLTGNTTTLKIK